MKVRLNLMPWREQRRASAVRRFQLVLVASLVAALLAVMALDQAARARLARQVEAVGRQQLALDRLETTAARIDQLREARRAVEAQRSALATLRGGQALIPDLFRGLEQAMPEGAQLIEISLEEERLRLTGLAASASVVAQFMRGLQRMGDIRDLELVHLRHQARGDEFLLVGRLLASEP
ncbi:PilN domain-containing protein [Pseudomonas sp. GD03858]|uniref:PilN domain-containing protein n=1 Tax=unclassified Pseudomonas TaxID=196821 RepID=UPI0024493423|nr:MULTISPECIES: PilN domain-containing protein [unclassified Pseudomonas]MDH0648841.1 PilN domain-containing protein [Pseudomonas sp. GD03867]MDH0664037.1 PilN domain-containing protein [Pseudomonas sp. GD03858]